METIVQNIKFDQDQDCSWESDGDPDGPSSTFTVTGSFTCEIQGFEQLTKNLLEVT